PLSSDPRVLHSFPTRRSSDLVAGIEDLLPKLGAKGRTAMIGYVFDEKWANANQEKIARFIAMTRAAKEILSTSDAEWEKISHPRDRKSTRLNSSHVAISYAVF